MKLIISQFPLCCVRQFTYKQKTTVQVVDGWHLLLLALAYGPSTQEAVSFIPPAHFMSKNVTHKNSRQEESRKPGLQKQQPTR